MKKFIAGLLAAAVIPLNAAAIAADGSITSISVDPDTQYITVTGKITSDNARDRVTLRVTKAGETVSESTVICTYQVNTDENGVYKFGFSMPNGTAADEYNVYIKTEGADSAKKSFEFFGDVSDKLKEDVNDASSKNELKEFFESNGGDGMEMFGIDSARYNNLESNKDFVILAVYNAKEKTGGFENGKQLRNIFEQALLIAEIREGRETVTDDNLEILTVDYTSKDGTGTYKTMYKTALEKKITDKAVGAVRTSSVEDAEDFWEVYNNTVTETVIAGTQYWTEVRDFIQDNKELIDEYADIDWDAYEKNKQTVCKAFVKGSYGTLRSFAEALEDKVDKPDSGNGTGGGNGGGGGGGSSSGSSTGIKPSGVQLPNISSGTSSDKTSNETEYIFEDLRRTPWANTAVATLVKAGIIDGYGDGTYRPERSVTREEFVTMVVKAFYPNADGGDCGFADVPKTSWSYKYIAAASGLGLIEGVGDNMFGPERNITRQDMAVIIQRILKNTGKITGAAEAASFSDEAQVSDYALPAVKLLRAEGIVNGDDNNNFNPMAEATRAESAVIIYNMLGK